MLRCTNGNTTVKGSIVGDHFSRWDVTIGMRLDFIAPMAEANEVPYIPSTSSHPHYRVPQSSWSNEAETSDVRHVESRGSLLNAIGDGYTLIVSNNERAKDMGRRSVNRTVSQLDDKMKRECAKRRVAASVLFPARERADRRTMEGLPSVVTSRAQCK